MRRYLILALAIFIAFLTFMLVLKILNKISNKNSLFYAILSGLLSFIITIILGFMILEKNSSSINTKYTPPVFIDGKVLEGKFQEKKTKPE